MYVYANPFEIITDSFYYKRGIYIQNKQKEF